MKRHLGAEPLLGNEPRSVEELPRGDSLASFDLNPFQLESCPTATGDQQRAALDLQSAGRSRCAQVGRWFARDLAIPSTECGEGARPGLQAANAVVDFLCVERPVDSPVLFLKRWGHGRLG